ncbi:hypothetical protein ACFUJY_25250 [Streptomyces sp. NPDC057249]|uniref:hypothetical protein n=1 Tax=Streptomyces sp. NPDC057249 TaxID=3346067 RepID=UPI00362F2900
MTTVAAPSDLTNTASALRRLYFVRAAFAILWALVMFATADGISPFVAALLVLYPLFDVGAAVVDANASRATRAPVLLYVNMAVSLAAAVGVGIASASGIPAVLRVWGAWAVVAGLVQLVVAVPRRRMGGQWPMILSGGISVLAGASFVGAAGAEDPTLTSAIGYAVPGGIFFLVSALRLGRSGGDEDRSGRGASL